MVKLDDPAVVGVPLITPLVESSDSPAGSEPLLNDQRYGCVPPVALSVV